MNRGAMNRGGRSKRQQPAPALPQVITQLTIDSLGQQGDGLARYDGQPVFVPFALPGEQLRVRLGATREKGRVGQIEEVLVPAADRV
ncbi:MAG: TRAM domain-containing protein, partial [Dongiaceae bacterium]